VPSQQVRVLDAYLHNRFKYVSSRAHESYGVVMDAASSDFIAKAEAVTGMTREEIEWWASRQEFEMQQYAKDLGHCCWAGATAAPHPCPWHPVA
jgi:hypothetical protein